MPDWGIDCNTGERGAAEGEDDDGGGVGESCVSQGGEVGGGEEGNTENRIFLSCTKDADDDGGAGAGDFSSLSFRGCCRL